MNADRLILLAMNAGAQARAGWYATRNTMRAQPECPRAILTYAHRFKPDLSCTLACVRAFQIGWNESASTYVLNRIARLHHA